MSRPLQEIRGISQIHKCPVIVAGDIFHKWNPTPELINFAIKGLKFPYGTFAIPGQHDLPNHRYEDIRKSGYWSLHLSGTILNLPRRNVFVCSKYMTLHAFPWGANVYNDPAPPHLKGQLIVAVVHDYCWDKGHCFPGAPPEKHWKEHYNQLRIYDASFFGDNHIGFIKPNSGLVNCGGLMRRNVDQIDYRPAIYLLHKSGSISRQYLDVSQDKTLDQKEAQEKKEAAGNLLKFIKAMGQLEEVNEDFVQSCDFYMKKQKTDPIVRRMVMESLEEK